MGNRFSVIHETTSPDQWHYGESNLNPADKASRGIDASKTGGLDIRLNGPKFIWQWPQENLPSVVAEDDVDVKNSCGQLCH